MKYWVSFSAFQLFEMVADITLAFILPFYIELKLLSVLWLVIGTKLIFDSIVHRELSKREKAIDRWLVKMSKARDEVIAIVWHEISRCSIRLITSLMAGGMSICFVQPNESLPSGCASPAISDNEDHEANDDSDETIIQQEHEQQELDQVSSKRTLCIGGPDHNENSVSMEWSAITPPSSVETTKNGNPKAYEPQIKTTVRPLPSLATRKSARRELMHLRTFEAAVASATSNIERL